MIWYDPDKQGVDKLNGVLLKLTVQDPVGMPNVSEAATSIDTRCESAAEIESKSTVSPGTDFGP